MVAKIRVWSEFVLTPGSGTPANKEASPSRLSKLDCSHFVAKKRLPVSLSAEEVEILVIFKAFGSNLTLEEIRLIGSASALMIISTAIWPPREAWVDLEESKIAVWSEGLD